MQFFPSLFAVIPPMSGVGPHGLHWSEPTFFCHASNSVPFQHCMPVQSMCTGGRQCLIFMQCCACANDTMPRALWLACMCTYNDILLHVCSTKCTHQTLMTQSIQHKTVELSLKSSCFNGRVGKWSSWLTSVVSRLTGTLSTAQSQLWWFCTEKWFWIFAAVNLCLISLTEGEIFHPASMNLWLHLKFQNLKEINSGGGDTEYKNSFLLRNWDSTWIAASIFGVIVVRNSVNFTV